MTKIKVCGLTTWEDAKRAVDLGADLLGFIFVSSPRQVAPEAARDIIRRLPAAVETVGVVRDRSADDIAALQAAVGFGWAQLHGDEPPETAKRFHPRVIKAFSAYRHGVATFKPFAGAVLLLDQPKRVPARPGRPAPPPAARALRKKDGAGARPRSGAAADAFIHLARQAKHFGRVLLAGGLDPETVGAWVDRLRPWGVDVARGVERYPGRKDPEKLRAFIEAVRAAR